MGFEEREGGFILLVPKLSTGWEASPPKRSSTESVTSNCSKHFSPKIWNTKHDPVTSPLAHTRETFAYTGTLCHSRHVGPKLPPAKEKQNAALVQGVQLRGDVHILRELRG